MPSDPLPPSAAWPARPGGQMPLEQVMDIEQLNRLQVALRQISQAMLRARTASELFRRVCEIFVETGGFAMAWVGCCDPETRRLMPVAQAGDANGFLQSTDSHSDALAGIAPAGRAFHDGEPYICNDLLAEPATLPWRAEIERRGFLACAGFPIRSGGLVCGTLSIYAASAGAFRGEQLALLGELADDIAFALDKLTREAVADAEQRLASGLVEAMPGVFYLYDERGRFLRWNSNFERVSGYSGTEIAAMHPLDFFCAEDRPFIEQRIGEVFEKGEATVEALFLRKDGTAAPYFFTGKRIALGGELRLVGVGVDITQRKHAEDALKRSEERYRTTLDTTLESCQLLGFDWRYLYLNPAAAIQNRRANSELLGRAMPEAWPGIESSTIFALLRRCMEKRVPEHAEIEFGFADGSRGWFDVRAQPVPEGIFVLSIDISERKQAERALHELNQNLERKVAERTLDLEAARVRAEAADRIKSAFLATMSHELRTPLNSILGFTGIVLKGMAGPLNPEQSKQLGMVQGSARHLLDLINDVLDISKIEAGQLEVRCAPFDLRASIERVVSSVLPMAAKKGLSVRAVLPDQLEPMASDQRRVEQILINLLNNAIKFTDRGEVTLTVALIASPEPAAPGGPRRAAQIRVADTGIGMKEDDLSLLFQPFRQIDSGLQRQHEGTGLGLAICRRLTGLLGGTIHAESRLGQGSVFTVVLPLHMTGNS